MSDQWIETKVGDICEVFDGPHATPERTSDGPVFLGISSLNSGRIDLEQSDHISEEDFIQWTRRVTPAGGDIVFSYETRLGEAGIIPEGLRCCLGRRMGLLRVKDKSKVDARFLLYNYLGPRFQALISERTVFGSTVERIPLKEVPDFPMALPSLSEQKAIAHILGTLDDKIELNRKTNDTLDAMAKALFKSWFVDFDPVIAKAEGRPTELPAEISDLFPDSFEDSELGEIPSGWTVGKIRDLIEKTGMGPFGSRMKTETFQQSGVPIIKGGNLKGMLVEGCGPDYLSHEHAAELKSACVRAGDIVITHRGTLGQVSMVPLEGMVDEYIVSQSQFYLKPASIASGVFLLYFFHSPVGQSRLLANSSGVGVPSLSRPSTLTPEIDLILPPHPLLDLFAKQVVAKQRLFLSKQYEASTLCSVRDALLPKLISGEIRIPDAEKMLEEVGI